MKLPRLSIITVTHNRRELLLRCIESVCKQDYRGAIEHIIIGDDCDFIAKEKGFISEYYEHSNKRIKSKIVNRSRNSDIYVWERVASHKNFAVKLSSGDFIINLDDDNTFDTDHISCLVKEVSKGYKIVHSWRKLFWESGQPYLVDQYPWIIGDDPMRAEILYKIQFEQGIFSTGSNIVKDTLFLKYKGNFYCTVDASEWMIDKDLFTEGLIEYTDDYSYTDILYGHCEDYLFGTRLRDLGFEVGCTKVPSLNYYLSGNSQKPE